MLGGESADPTLNGCAEAAGELAIVLPARADSVASLLDEARVEAAATGGGTGRGIPGATPKLSLWPGPGTVCGLLVGATKQYQTTPAKAQTSSIAGSGFFISIPYFKLTA
jgi:hypothetical protein